MHVERALLLLGGRTMPAARCEHHADHGAAGRDRGDDGSDGEDTTAHLEGWYASIRSADVHSPSLAAARRRRHRAEAVDVGRRRGVDTPAAQGVAAAAGFRREGVLRSARFSARRGRRVDFALYSLLADELPG